LENNALKFDSGCKKKKKKKKKKKQEANMMYLKASTRNLEMMAALIANMSNIPYFCHPYKRPGSS